MVYHIYTRVATGMNLVNIHSLTTSAADVLGVVFPFRLTVVVGEGVLPALVLVETMEAVDSRFTEVAGVIFRCGWSRVCRGR